MAKCERIFERVQCAANAKCKCDVRVWNAMMSAYAENGRTQRATDLYSLMIQIAVLPDLRTFKTLIDAHCDAGDVAEAQRVWTEEMDAQSRHRLLLTHPHTLSKFLARDVQTTRAAAPMLNAARQ